MTYTPETDIVTIESNGRELELCRQELEVFAAVNEIFKGARLVMIRMPGEPDRPCFGRGKR